jgi:hypothetical protein
MRRRAWDGGKVRLRVCWRVKWSAEQPSGSCRCERGRKDKERELIVYMV